MWMDADLDCVHRTRRSNFGSHDTMQTNNNAYRYSTISSYKSSLERMGENGDGVPYDPRIWTFDCDGCYVW